LSIVVVDVKFVFIVAVFADEVPAAVVVVVVANPAAEEAEVVGIQVLIKFLT